MDVKSETITTENPRPRGEGLGKIVTETVAYAELHDTNHPEEQDEWVWWIECRAITYGPGGEILSEGGFTSDIAETWMGDPPTVETLTRELRGFLADDEEASA